jgi:hypothetical protein
MESGANALHEALFFWDERLVKDHRVIVFLMFHGGLVACDDGVVDCSFMRHPPDRSPLD